ncbi:DUF6624 domain-containing protein [Pedobacter nototheniae]|uniref:DUF6624 domain-containing protein n=1 Tax=Pedobacter nototheniae TaxID=2488994 RepID=UPI00292D6B94|nr:DUF6624 domain-containing protein [Pedobacter nototheniae]
MKIYSLLLFMIFSAVATLAQKPVHLKLKEQLDSILQTDQGIREFVDSETSEKRKDTLAQFFNYPKEELKKHAWNIMPKIDSANLKKVEIIISKYGYPGKTLVGEPANTAVFYVIQHNPTKISAYYPLIEKAGKKGELPFKYVAMMLDRKLTQKGEDQIYGTQVYGLMINNPGTGKKEFFQYVMPIKDPKNVNKRRKKAGFDSTVEANALRLGVVYKAYTKAEIDKIIKQ